VLKKSAVETYKDRKRSARSFDIHHEVGIPEQPRCAVNTRISPVDDDLEAAALAGLEWLINAPKFEQIVVGADGIPLWMSCVDPRAFALHKYWISRRDDRDPLKRRRDAAQARAVAAVAVEYLRLEFSVKELSALPADLVRAGEALIRAA
jgi:hypothetical protein